MIRAFDQANPPHRVHPEYVVGLAGHYNTKMRQQVMTDDLPDVALIQLGPFCELAEHFADLGPIAQRRSLEDALVDTGVDAFRWQGESRGLPVSGGSLLLYANLDCFERAGALVSALKGRTRLYTWNPRYPFGPELRSLLAKALDLLPAAERRRYFAERRRPRRAGKPL